MPAISGSSPSAVRATALAALRFFPPSRLFLLAFLLRALPRALLLRYFCSIRHRQVPFQLGARARRSSSSARSRWRGRHQVKCLRACSSRACSDRTLGEHTTRAATVELRAETVALSAAGAPSQTAGPRTASRDRARRDRAMIGCQEAGGWKASTGCTTSRLLPGRLRRISISTPASSGCGWSRRASTRTIPGTYHLFYADAAGHPGHRPDLLPLGAPGPAARGPWAEHRGVAGRAAGQPRLLGAAARRTTASTLGPVETRFGERVLPLTDTHGLRRRAGRERLGDAAARSRRGTRSPIPAAHRSAASRGRACWSASSRRRTRVPDAACSGFSLLRSDGGWQRYGVAGRRSPAATSICRKRPAARRGAWGVGSIHHLAWRVDDEAHQERLRARIDAGRSPARRR